MTVGQLDAALGAMFRGCEVKALRDATADRMTVHVRDGGVALRFDILGEAFAQGDRSVLSEAYEGFCGAVAQEANGEIEDAKAAWGAGGSMVEAIGQTSYKAELRRTQRAIDEGVDWRPEETVPEDFA
jgi:hypothetical protein